MSVYFFFVCVVVAWTGVWVGWRYVLPGYCWSVSVGVCQFSEQDKIQSKTEDFELDNSTTVVVETANHKPVDLRRTHTGKPKEWKDEE